MGTFTDYYETLVPAHGTALIRLEGSKRHDRTCYEAEYAFMQEFLPDNKQAAHFTPKSGASGEYIIENLGITPYQLGQNTKKRVYSTKGGDILT